MSTETSKETKNNNEKVIQQTTIGGESSNPTSKVPSTSPNLSQEIIKNTGLLNLTPQQCGNAVYVTNLSSTATIKQVSEFFSYCGSIEKIIQEVDPSSQPNDPKQFAVVVFDSDQAYSVALLLGSSVIEGSPINVHPYSNFVPSAKGSGDSSSSSSGSKSGNSAVSVVASLIASGYVQGELLVNDMKAQAKELDSKVNVSQKVKHAYQVSLEKCKKFDNDIKFTETLANLKSKAVETSHQVYKTIDDALGLQQKAKDAKEFTLKTASLAMEYEPVKQSVEMVSTGWGYLKDSWNSMTQETTDEINKQKQTHAALHPQASEASSSNTGTSVGNEGQHSQTKPVEKDLLISLDENTATEPEEASKAKDK
jgi:RNA recognition motif-containing protein